MLQGAWKNTSFRMCKEFLRSKHTCLPPSFPGGFEAMISSFRLPPAKRRSVLIHSCTGRTGDRVGEAADLKGGDDQC